MSVCVHSGLNIEMWLSRHAMMDSNIDILEMSTKRILTILAIREYQSLSYYLCYCCFVRGVCVMG